MPLNICKQWTSCDREINYSSNLAWVYTCSEWCFQELNSMGRRRTHVIYHGRFQIVHGIIRDSRGHWCGLDPYSKAKNVSLAIDYYSFKLKAYNMQLWAIIDHKKHILDVFVGMPWSIKLTHKSCTCLQSTKRWNGGICSMNMMHMKASSSMSLETRATHWCHSWWCFTSKLGFDIPF
jgi:hypothetical protein